MSDGVDGAKLVILYTGDLHSQMEPFPKNHPRYPRMGGWRGRAERIRQIRELDPRTLLVDCGDACHAAPDRPGSMGEAEADLFRILEYDAVTLGNHEFDFGPEGLRRQMARHRVPVVNANYIATDPALRNRISTHRIVRKGPWKIGLFGLGIDPVGFISAKNFDGFLLRDPVAVAGEQVAMLRSEGCDLILCLSHLGFEYPEDPRRPCDRMLANRVEGLDVILGGHTHLFLSEPAVLPGPGGRPVAVGQSGLGGVCLGWLEVTFSEHRPVQFRGALLPIGSEGGVLP